MATLAPLTVDDLPTVFADVEPVPQDDGPSPVCQIDYSVAFITAFDMFRAILKKDERSDRSLRLTWLCLTLNPANYTVWHFRRLCLQALSVGDTTDLERIAPDLQMAVGLGGGNPKNYQLWYHRRSLLEQVSDAATLLSDYLATELEYIQLVLEHDGKNYHAWSHRQWIVKAVDDETVWKDELAFSDGLIQEDPRNNSAWNQRWFAAHQGGNLSVLSLETAQTEIDFAVAGARLDPSNESPWRYLIAIVREQVRHDGTDSATKAKILADTLEKTFSVQQVLRDAGKDPAECANLTSAAIDLLEYKADVPSLEQAAQLATNLAEEHDPIRLKYWNMRTRQIQEAMQTLKV